MKRCIAYRTKTLKDLLTSYADESSRIDAEDKTTTRYLIQDEVMQRVKETFKMLDENPKEVDQIYSQLINY